MKILQVSNFLAPVHGGSAEVPLQISKALVKLGHEVTIYTSSRNLDKKIFSDAGVRVYPLHSWSQAAGFDITPGIIKKAREETGEFDIIHLHNYRTYQNIILNHYAGKYGVPYILQSHGSLATYFQKGTIKKLFDLMWGRKIIRDAVKVFAVTPEEASQFDNFRVNEDKIEIIPHGINLDEFSNPMPTGDFRRKYDIGNNIRIILFLGRLHKMKGLDILAEAYADVMKKDNGIKLVIAGPDDGYLSVLRNIVKRLRIEDHVIFTGPLYGKDKIRAYCDCDIYVLPSSYEIFGITVLEAWACSKPVIVTERCGLANNVRGKAGLVIPYNKSRLAEAISEMLDNLQLRQDLGANGRSLVEKEYNWTKIASRVTGIYENILSEKKTGVRNG